MIFTHLPSVPTGKSRLGGILPFDWAPFQKQGYFTTIGKFAWGGGLPTQSHTRCGKLKVQCSSSVRKGGDALLAHEWFFGSSFAGGQKMQLGKNWVEEFGKDVAHNFRQNSREARHQKFPQALCFL